MAKRKRSKNLKKKIVRVAIPSVLLLLFIYIVYQLVSGEKSIFTWMQIGTQVSEFKKQNAILESQKAIWELKTKRLNPNTIDEDYADEEIRKSLPLVKPKDTIIFIKKAEE